MRRSKPSTVIGRAQQEVTGFQSMFARLEQKVQLGGMSESTLFNYGRCIAKMALHFKCVPIELEEEQINGYLQNLTHGPAPSKSYFKHTVYGLRFLFRVYDLEDRIIRLPNIKASNKLPVVLSLSECKLLFRSGRLLKYRVMLCLVYSAGLRSQEVRKLKLSDIDYDRMTIHIRQTKYNKDRYLPLSSLMAKGLKKYIEACTPKVYLFNGRSIGSALSANGVQWAMKETLKRSGITKDATVHTLRHSYATHLLEYGMDIDTVSKLLGHAHLSTTLVYLHVARLGGSDQFSPFDRLYPDYRHSNQSKVMTLDSYEFVRRFTLHLLPKGFTRIRHYGILSSQWKSRIFPNQGASISIDWKTIWESKGLQVDQCSQCRKGQLTHLRKIPPSRGPPYRSTTNSHRTITQ